jgi:GNAT superfamily N-acetyltransferase
MILSSQDSEFTKKTKKRIYGMARAFCKETGAFVPLHISTLNSDPCFIYFKNNKPIAYIYGGVWLHDRFKNSNCFRIWSLFVNKKYRRRGIANKLRTHLIEYVKCNKKCSKIVTLSKGNPDIYYNLNFINATTKTKNGEVAIMKSENGYMIYELNLN